MSWTVNTDQVTGAYSYYFILVFLDFKLIYFLHFVLYSGQLRLFLVKAITPQLNIFQMFMASKCNKDNEW